MKFLDEHFKLIVVILQLLTFLLVSSIKMSTCTLANDMRTTKKVTKTLNEKTLTGDELDKRLQSQTQEYLTKEKELDNVKDTLSIKKILNDTTKIRK